MRKVEEEFNSIYRWYRSRITISKMIILSMLVGVLLVLTGNGYLLVLSILAPVIVGFLMIIYYTNKFTDKLSLLARETNYVLIPNIVSWLCSEHYTSEKEISSCFKTVMKYIEVKQLSLKKMFPTMVDKYLIHSSEAEDFGEYLKQKFIG